MGIGHGHSVPEESQARFGCAAGSVGSIVQYPIADRPNTVDKTLGTGVDAPYLAFGCGQHTKLTQPRQDAPGDAAAGIGSD
jgi:hypothetical protein